MKNFWLFFLVAGVLSLWHTAFAGSEVMAQPATVCCNNCHTEVTSLVPQGHPPINGNEATSCMACHNSDRVDLGKKNGFFTQIHLAHLPLRENVHCLSCHSWSPGTSFGLLDGKESWGSPAKEDMDVLKEIFESWAASNFLDNLHAKASLSCANCHGKDMPKLDSTVTNAKCLDCHGPIDQLAQKSEPADFKDRNPHRSHLGEIDCTVCHKAHSESKIYCLQCHVKFAMSFK